MDNRGKRVSGFTVLDAILMAVLPKKHQIAAIAASLIAAGEGFPTPIREANSYVSMLALTSDEEEALVDEILGEVQRQAKIKIDRLDRQRKLKKARAMGSQLDKITRINRVCGRIFGEPTDWVHVGRLSPRVVDPFYSWLHRSPDGVLVAGVLVTSLDGWEGKFDDPAAGFVYYERGGVTRFARLPTIARDVEELCVLLGLHPRLLDSRLTRVDWRRRAFIVANTNHLPWVYP
jgi:hypothetical protein